MQKSDLQYSIKKSERIISGVMAWSKNEFAQRTSQLSEMQQQLEQAITEEESLMTKISMKLDQIAALKLEISKRVPETNGFSVSIQD